jgi:hypothetical protein
MKSLILSALVLLNVQSLLGSAPVLKPVHVDHQWSWVGLRAVLKPYARPQSKRGWLQNLTLFVVGAPALAGDWFCTSQSSKLVGGGTAVMACGIGIAAEEGAARALAFDLARAEFNRICTASSYCRSGVVAVEPKRTQCGPMSDGRVKCYRAVEFIVRSGERVTVPVPAPAPASEAVTSSSLDPALCRRMRYQVETYLSGVKGGKRGADARADYQRYCLVRR